MRLGYPDPWEWGWSTIEDIINEAAKQSGDKTAHG
jgi:hypothetical protein